MKKKRRAPVLLLVVAVVVVGGAEGGGRRFHSEAALPSRGGVAVQRRRWHPEAALPSRGGVTVQRRRCHADIPMSIMSMSNDHEMYYVLYSCLKKGCGVLCTIILDPRWQGLCCLGVVPPT